ncbi:MAG TPA: ABC transporter substrate-binding protein [Gemmatimonadales bacterium]|nr:ABC transporter substrate-binding protein [Gemmatimonadales bacterium]
MTPPIRHAVLAGLLAAACRAPAPRLEQAAPAPSDSSCTLAAGPAAKRDTITVAVTEAVEPGHAPVPRNGAERLVFAQLYETLLRVDCQGRIVPGLAQTWDQASGDRWTFSLRADARFWDGAPVTARDVVAAWRLRDSTLARDATVGADRTLTVRAPDTPLQAFADPALAVTKPAPGGGWPIGTGSRWMTGAASDDPDALVAQPVSRAGLSTARFAIVPPGGVRDALDGGSDVIVTRDPAALEYATRLPGYSDLPLDWNRTYVLLGPGRDHPGAGELRLESLREAVRGEARPAEWHEGGQFWFSDLRRCKLPGARELAGNAGARHRVVYDQADRSAADLAARLVGLGVLGRGTVAAGLPSAAFGAAVRAGEDAWYVLDLPRRVYDPCRAALGLPPWSPAGAIEPLLDVRAHAVVRRGLPRMVMEWDGTLRLSPP